LLGAIVALALAQCPGGQCYAPAAQPVPVPVVAYYAPAPAYYYAPRYIHAPRRVVRGYTVCTPQGCYRR